MHALNFLPTFAVSFVAIGGAPRCKMASVSGQEDTGDGSATPVAGYPGEIRFPAFPVVLAISAIQPEAAPHTFSSDIYSSRWLQR